MAGFLGALFGFWASVKLIKKVTGKDTIEL